MGKIYAIALLVSALVGGGSALPSQPISPVPRSDLETTVSTYNARSSLLNKRKLSVGIMEFDVVLINLQAKRLQLITDAHMLKATRMLRAVPQLKR